MLNSLSSSLRGWAEFVTRPLLTKQQVMLQTVRQNEKGAGRTELCKTQRICGSLSAVINVMSYSL